MTGTDNARQKITGRGALENPTSRFEAIEVVPDPDPDWDEPERPNNTKFFKDNSQKIITYNDSPDVGFAASINPYRGCEHGCIYCYARPTHEYLGMSCGLDFETKILVKTDAPQLLRKALSSKSWKPQVIAMSGVTDPYQPIERKLKLTRQCLEVLAEFRNPVGIITKNHLVTRDIDLLSQLASVQAACVFVSVTTLDEKLARVMEPRTATPALRLSAIRELHQAGIPVGVLMGPIVPGLTDHEIDSILKQAADAGAQTAGYTMLRLPYGVKDLFQSWLEEHFPDRKNKVLNRIAEVRSGKLNDTEFGRRMVGQGAYAQYIAQMFELSMKRHNLNRSIGQLSTGAFHTSAPEQLKLF
jgi:DNA repair photolyase